MRKTGFLIREEGSTYEDYANIPESAGRYELADGELWAMSPAPSVKHQLVSARIGLALSRCDKEYHVLYAPVDVILSQHTTLQPDIVLVRRDRPDILSNRGVEGPPDLVVEILSPSTIQRDRGRKKDIYAYYHVPEYWIVDVTSGTVEQYLLHDGQYHLADVFQGASEVRSPRMVCVPFTMDDILSQLPELH